MKLIILLLFIMNSLYLDMYAQSSKQRQEIELLSYNVGFGVLSTTIGALINKPRSIDVWTCIKKAAWQGAVGGTLQYTGKKVTYQITKTGYYWWGFGSKLIHSAGASICYNAALNNPFGQYWAIDYAAFRFNFNVKQGHVQFQPQLNPLFLYDLYYGLSHGSVDWKTSMKLGTFTFKTESTSIESRAIAEALYNSIVYTELKTPNAMAHELVHIYQFNEYRVMNTYFEPLKNKIKNPTVKNIFKWVYIEIPNMRLFYNLLYHPVGTEYYKNLYEFEAQFFSKNKYVPR